MVPSCPVSWDSEGVPGYLPQGWGAGRRMSSVSRQMLSGVSEASWLQWGFRWPLGTGLFQPELLSLALALAHPPGACSQRTACLSVLVSSGHHHHSYRGPPLNSSETGTRLFIWRFLHRSPEATPRYQALFGALGTECDGTDRVPALAGTQGHRDTLSLTVKQPLNHQV